MENYCFKEKNILSFICLCFELKRKKLKKLFLFFRKKNINGGNKKMKDLSLHVLDIVQNSVRAEADFIEFGITESDRDDKLEIFVNDNGCGMTKEMIEKVTDPFVTTRTTRKVGLGLPLLKQNAERCGGYLTLESEVGVGTQLYTVFEKNNIDRPPLGDMISTIMTLIICNPEIDFFYKHKTDEGEYFFDTREIKEILEGIPFSNPEVSSYLKEMLRENLLSLKAEDVF